MKSLRKLLGALIVAALPLARGADEWATMANRVAFSLDLSKATTPDVCVLRGAGEIAGVGDLFKGCKSEPQSGEKDEARGQWILVNIPVQIFARGRNKAHSLAPAHYVPELKVTVYLLVRRPSGSGEGKTSAPTSDSYGIVKKEITYVDIPLEKDPFRGEKGREMGKATMNVGVFIPRSTAAILTDKFNKPIKADDISKILAGYAVMATFNGEPCDDFTPPGENKTERGETRNSKLFDKKLVTQLGGGNWWKEGARKRAKFEELNVDVCSIAESPYAPFYSKYYPRVKPMYGVSPLTPGESLESNETTSSSTTEDSTRSQRSDSEKTTTGTSTKRSGTTGRNEEDYDRDL